MACRICQSTCTSVYDFGKQPLANDFFFEKDAARKAPLELVMCDTCKTLQLKNVVPPTSIFSNNYNYKSYASSPLIQHFDELAQYIQQEYGVGPGNNIIDIGCNDGSFLALFKKDYAVGVDPAAEFDPYLTQYCNYFDREFAEKYLTEYSFPKVITALNVMAHVPEIHSFVNAIRSMMSSDTILIIEVQNSSQLVHGAFDQIYHEHYFYFDEKTLTYLLNHHDIQVIKYTNFPFINGGTLRVECKIGKQTTPLPSTYFFDYTPDNMMMFIENGINNIRSIFQDYPILNDNRPLIGVGAPAKAALMCSQVEELKSIQYCLDTTAEKTGKYIPGTNIKIHFDDGTWSTNIPSDIFIFSWNYFSSIMKSHDNFKGHNVICPRPAEVIMCL